MYLLSKQQQVCSFNLLSKCSFKTSVLPNFFPHLFQLFIHRWINVVSYYFRLQILDELIVLLLLLSCFEVPTISWDEFFQLSSNFLHSSWCNFRSTFISSVVHFLLFCRSACVFFIRALPNPLIWSEYTRHMDFWVFTRFSELICIIVSFTLSIWLLTNLSDDCVAGKFLLMLVIVPDLCMYYTFLMIFFLCKQQQIRSRLYTQCVW